RRSGRFWPVRAERAPSWATVGLGRDRAEADNWGVGTNAAHIRRTIVAASTAVLLLAAPAFVAATDVAASAASVPVIVVGHDASATQHAVEAAGGDVHLLLDAVGGVAADLTGPEQRTVEATGLHVVPDAPATLTSTGFDRNGDLVQVAAL